MQITEKYLIIAMLIVLPFIFGLRAPNKLTKLIENRPEINLSSQNKYNSDTSCTIRPKESSPKEFRDTVKMDSKIWMLKQNMIIGY
jgi:hypothetical protein